MIGKDYNNKLLNIFKSIKKFLKKNPEVITYKSLDNNLVRDAMRITPWRIQNKVDAAADPDATVLPFCPRAIRTTLKPYFPATCSCSDHPKRGRA